MDGDEEDFVFYGTPIEREEDTSARKRKAVADAGQLRALAPWKQEVRDEEGRRRFHGAFTGGFSAGYYNTVGSKEGWTPQTFTSSRKSRADVKKQSIYNFLDEDDIKDMGGHALETSMQFDTFGFTAAEFACKQAEKEQEKRPSAIPGPVPDEIVIPASNSIGIKLLLKMGWRRGHSIKDNNANSLYEARREARRALLAFSGNEELTELKPKESTMSDSEEFAERMDDHIYSSKSTPPKQDLFGLGFDPYKHAPEFRDKKRYNESMNSNHGSKSGASKKAGKYAPGFGIGALEELDFEDEDIYATGFEYEQTEVEEAEPLRATKDSKHRLEEKRMGSLPGFKVASSSEYHLERFHAPVIPKNYEPYHKFPTCLETAIKIDELPPPEVTPPEDHNLKSLIDGFATLVARCGKRFEDLSKEKNRSNPLFSFLTGGGGHDYYERKLWEEKQKNLPHLRLSEDFNSKSSVKGMVADNRGKILGEKPLPRSSNYSSSSVALKEVLHFQSNLSDTFTNQISLVSSLQSAKPFQNDPAKQERFEQFLKDKYQGGLRSTQHSGSIMSETDRARERLDFEATAEAIEKGLQKIEAVPPTQQASFMAGALEQQFISPVVEETHQVSENKDQMASKVYPKREEFQWRPFPLLCKRFDIIDPFMGKPPALPRARSRMETLFFTTEPTKNAQTVDAFNRDSMFTSQSTSETQKKLQTEEPVIEQSTTNMQRPVDLYKAIFSDDSDDEDEKEADIHHVADSGKNNEGANTTLNRLIAGDFLESIGKELGLEVPPDTTSKNHKGSGATAPTVNAFVGSTSIPKRNEKDSSMLPYKEIGEHDEMTHEQRIQEHGPSSTPVPDKAKVPLDEDGKDHSSFSKNNLNRSGSKIAGTFYNLEEDKAEKIEDRLRNNNKCDSYHRCSDSPDIHSSGDQNQSKKSRTHEKHDRSKSRTSDSDTSSDEYQAKRNRVGSSHHRRSRMPYTESSSDSQDHSHSRTRSKKRSSREKSGRHSSGHHKHKRKSYSSYDDNRDGSDDLDRDRKSGSRRKHSDHSRPGDGKKYHQHRSKN